VVDLIEADEAVAQKRVIEGDPIEVVDQAEPLDRDQRDQPADRQAADGLQWAKRSRRLPHPVALAVCVTAPVGPLLTVPVAQLV
jgi:hypothetical protein